MIDPKNIWSGTAGLVADPEVFKDSVVRFRIAIDYAGNEKNSDNRTGYFNVTYFLNGSDSNAKFVRDQVTSGKMKKGSQLSIVGRLSQERWDDNGSNRERVVIVAEAITYAGGNRPAEATATTTSSSTSASASGGLPDF